MTGELVCPCCRSERFTEGFRYNSPPKGETEFAIPSADYRREYRVCDTCGHWLAVTDLELDSLYEGAYVDATYSKESVAETFDRIMALPPERSDNAQRVARIQEFWADRNERNVLDVGSGLGVFPARMRHVGWTCTALDPDERAASFAREHIGVTGVCADFLSAGGLGLFSLVTLNKVLEHVCDPLAMLARTNAFLADSGVVYVEVPDGERAATDRGGAEREEFFVEHLHVFSMSSMSLLARRSGLDVIHAARLREPSGKYTLYAFCERTPATRAVSSPAGQVPT